METPFWSVILLAEVLSLNDSQELPTNTQQE